jgi:hypothetical protein
MFDLLEVYATAVAIVGTLRKLISCCLVQLCVKLMNYLDTHF